MADKSKGFDASYLVTGLLGVAFVVLKLTGYISWSWWWVTAPFWGWPALGLILVIVGVFLRGINGFNEDRAKKRSALKDEAERIARMRRGGLN